MAVLSDIVYRTRLELGDQAHKFDYSAVGNGITTAFDLSAKPVDPATLLVTVNGTPMTNPTQYTVETDLGVIHFVNPPSNGAVIVASGTAFRYFSDSDIELFVNTVIEQHTLNRTDSMGSQVTLANLPAVEEYPVAILATIEALWALATDASFDINIMAPDGVTIPRAQRFQQLTAMIAQRQQQYKELCSALNIGLWRIEMGTLRRVSRTTNKLVPIYVAQEIDDSRRPERVYIQNDLNGRKPFPSTASIYDIAIYQGDNWEAIFDFPFDITNYDFKAQIRTYPNAPALYATFNVDKFDPVAGKLKLSLTTSQTKYLPARGFWDLQMTDPSNTNFEQTYIKGQVFVTQQVTLD